MIQDDGWFGNQMISDAKPKTDIFVSHKVEAKVQESPLETQVDGDHYKTKKIQPWEYIDANELDFWEGNVVKYITRWKDKNGIKDLEKIKHYVDYLIYREGQKNETKD